ncbi:hypothetical protein VTO73DRAFT_4813 [Trametes versicolor]
MAASYSHPSMHAQFRGMASPCCAFHTRAVTLFDSGIAMPNIRPLSQDPFMRISSAATYGHHAHQQAACEIPASAAASAVTLRADGARAGKATKIRRARSSRFLDLMAPRAATTPTDITPTSSPCRPGSPKCTVAFPLRRAQGCRGHAHIWQADGMRTLSRPVATRTAPACTPDDRTRLRSTAPAPVPRAIRLLRTHESETSDGKPVILGRAPIRRTNPPVAGSQGSRTHATASDSRICICVPFRPPTLYPPPAALLTISRPCPPSGRSQIAATHDVNAPSAFALAFTFTSRCTTYSPHAPPFLERAKPEARARLRTGVPASRTRTLYSIPRQQTDARTRRTARALDPSFLPLAAAIRMLLVSSQAIPARRHPPAQPAANSHTRAACTAAGDMAMPWRPTWLGKSVLLRASSTSPAGRACIPSYASHPRHSTVTSVKGAWGQRGRARCTMCAMDSGQAGSPASCETGHAGSLARRRQQRYQARSRVKKAKTQTQTRGK